MAAVPSCSALDIGPRTASKGQRVRASAARGCFDRNSCRHDRHQAAETRRIHAGGHCRVHPGRSYRRLPGVVGRLPSCRNGDVGANSENRHVRLIEIDCRTPYRVRLSRRRHEFVARGAQSPRNGRANWFKDNELVGQDGSTPLARRVRGSRNLRSSELQKK